MRNRRDACPGTLPGELVDHTGCSLCPCTGPSTGGTWASRTAYTSCVRAEARRLLREGRLARSTKRHTVAMAKRSSCGRIEATRCCVFDPAGRSGRCRLVPTAACTALSAAGEGLDLGPGSCLAAACAR